MEELIEIFLRTREALSHPNNDFSWSSWNSREEAVEEIDTIIAKLHAGHVPNRVQMEVLFAPTGPIQEVSLSSGWARCFLQLAEDFDAALERLDTSTSIQKPA